MGICVHGCRLSMIVYFRNRGKPRVASVAARGGREGGLGQAEGRTDGQPPWLFDEGMLGGNCPTCGGWPVIGADDIGRPKREKTWQK